VVGTGDDGRDGEVGALGSGAGEAPRADQRGPDDTGDERGIADAADDGDLRRTARRAVEAMRRGVVDYASVAE
jgi:hypothetical protein